MPTIFDFVRSQTLQMRPVGRYLFPWFRYTEPFLVHLSWSISLTLVMLITGIGMVLHIFYGEIANNLDVTLIACYWAFVLDICVKVLAIRMGRSSLGKAFKQLKDVHPKSARMEKAIKLNEYFGLYKKWEKIMFFMDFLNLALFTSIPFIKSVVEYVIAPAEQRSFNYELPFIGINPIRMTNPLVYIISYMLQIYGCYILTSFNLGSDLLLISLVHLLNMHFEYLAKSIREFEPTGTDKDIKELGHFISYHRDIIHSSERVDATFSPAIFTNYFACGLMMCVLGFQIMAGPTAEMLVKFFVLLTSLLFHVYVICMYGDRMITLSLDVSDAFFEHRWYLAEKRYQKMVVLPIARAQRPAHLTAFKFFDVTMESFKTLVSTTYQFFTLLNSTLDEE